LPDLTPEELRAQANVCRDEANLMWSARMSESMLRLAACYEMLATELDTSPGVVLQWHPRNT
jgi:hypothetical protein